MFIDFNFRSLQVWFVEEDLMKDDPGVDTWHSITNSDQTT